MLCIEREPLTDSDHVYIAFRLAFFETLERIALAEQMGLAGDGAYGYLAEVPFLRNVAPQVQLDLLLDCWRRLCSQQMEPATLLDESIIYAACEGAARTVEYDPDFAIRHLSIGPRRLRGLLGESLGDQLRFVHLSLPSDAHFLVLSQFQDVDPENAAKLRTTFGIEAEACEPMFDALGRWHVSPGFRQNGDGLLDSQEVAHASEVLRLNRATTPW